MTTISGRRTYTEDELQNALQDILSGKLGTRRAAVLYGIPRSTLRNKVYKLAIEQKREASLTGVAPELADLDDDDKDCSGGEEEKDAERGYLPAEDIYRVAAAQGLAAFEKLRHSNLDQRSDQFDLTPDSMENDGRSPTNSCKPNATEGGGMANLMDPNIILQGLLIGGALSGLGNNKAMGNSTLGILPEFLRNIILHNELLKNAEGRVDTEEVGVASLLTKNFLSAIADSARKLDHPATASSCSTPRSQTNDNSEEGHIKAGLFKQVRNPSTFSPTPLPAASVPNFQAKNGDGMSPQNLSQNNSGVTHKNNPLSAGLPMPLIETGSPPISGMSSVSLRDVIAKSISKSLQPHGGGAQESRDHHQEVQPHPSMESYKWPAISVKKGLGAEVNRFGGSSMMSSNAALVNQANNSTGTGGKGTRPKRGKYRNYDRDSLVEAVKAVQRGEMSVHRAGSYYGVPHSTLEYKVKERHLMRPRKREPKPQTEDRANCSLSSANKANDIGSMEKAKPLLGQAKTTLKAFEGASSNGIKGAHYLESTGVSTPLQYTPHMFWPHAPNFPGLSLDFARAAAASSGGSGASTFPTAESLFGAHLRQQFPDHAAGSAEPGQSGGSNGSGSGSNSTNNSKSTTPNSAASNYKPNEAQKAAREFAETLYDGASANGLLDGIIRNSLDRKSTDMPHGALLDQLKNNLQLANRKREAERQLEFGLGLPIKRERASPDHTENEFLTKDPAVTAQLDFRSATLPDIKSESFNGERGGTNMDAEGSLNMKVKDLSTAKTGEGS